MEKCSKCKTHEEVEDLKAEVEKLKKQLAEAEEIQQNVKEGVIEEGELQQIQEDINI